MGNRRESDHYSRRAKDEGHPARSIYKLEEIDARWKIFKRGQRVLDLGCAPGSWMQYAAAKVGAEGRVLGFDLSEVKIALPANAEARVGDIYALTRADLGGVVDVVVSDMAPHTMGDHKTDALRSAALAERALQVAEEHLAPGGCVVVKVLEGGDVPQIVKQMRTVYEKVELLRPRATRKHSTELFLVGLKKRGAAA